MTVRPLLEKTGPHWGQTNKLIVIQAINNLHITCALRTSQETQGHWFAVDQERKRGQRGPGEESGRVVF